MLDAAEEAVPLEPYVDDCECTHTRWVWRIIRGGTKQYGKQCLFCGKMQVTKKSAVPLNEDLTAYCPEVRDNYFERRRRCYERQSKMAEQQRMAEKDAWHEKYNEYLGSQRWAEKRQRVLERDGGICQACRKRPATEVHHLTYDHVFNEPLFDLVSICRICHRALTDRDKCNH